MTLAAAAHGRAVAERDPHPPPPPVELIAAWRTQAYGLPRGKGWRDEPITFDRMTHALNVYSAFKAFYGRDTMTETEFAEQYFELWKIVIDVEKLESANE